MCENRTFGLKSTRPGFRDPKPSFRLEIVAMQKGASAWLHLDGSSRARMAAAALGALFGLPMILAASSLAALEADVLPVPTITIYPGDAIKGEWLVDRTFAPTSPTRGKVVFSRESIVGKIARRTLLPGIPIPLNSVSEPKVVLNGAKVRIVFEDGALTIASYGAALQDGGIGDLVSLRNLETGLIVSGVVQPDGSVRLGGD